MNQYYFRSKIPKYEMHERQKNQKTNIADYQEIIPNRKLTVKRGVFPYAIHANPVSKEEVSGKDEHMPNDQNDSFQKPKNVFNLLNILNPREEPQAETKTKPATSTGFFGSNTQQHQSPIPSKSKKPWNEGITLSNSSNTTEMNKKVLLDQYLTQQYNIVVKAKTSSTARRKFINFDPQEALQICNYRQIGEVINESFIAASSKFKYSLEMTSTIRKKLCKLHIERKNEECLKETRTEFEKYECTAHKGNRSCENFPLTSPNDAFHQKKRAKNETNMDHTNGKFRLNNSIVENDTLSHCRGNDMRNQLEGGNDRIYHRTPRLCGVSEKSNGSNNLTSSSSPNINHNFIRNFGKERCTPEFPVKVDNINNIYKKKPLLPTNRGSFSPNDHLESECGAINSPTLFFSDTADSIKTPIDDKNNNTKMPSNNEVFTLDSAVFKRKFSPELANPIEILKCTRGKSKSNKKKTTRKKMITPNPFYSDSTCHGTRFKRYNKYRDDKFFTRRNKYSKIYVGK